MSSSSPAQADIPPPPPPQSKPAPVRGPSKVRIYSHSSLLYWWPVWVVGYIMATLSYYQGIEFEINKNMTLIHPSSNLGLLYFGVLFLVILVTNYSVRGLASGVVILGIGLMFVLLLYFNWWDDVFGWLLSHKTYLNYGAYLWFSNILFVLWVIVVFGLDRMNYWEIEPGQLIRDSVLGSGSKSYNTQGMSLEKHQDDLFRHWLLGLGSGDLQVRTSGASREQIDIHNVLFIGRKIVLMQRLIAEVPEE